MDLKKPKYRLLADDLRENIMRDFKAGESLRPRAMIGRYGVSRQTVRAGSWHFGERGDIRRRQDLRCRFQPETFFAGPGKSAFVSTYISEYVFPSIIRGAERC